jgi:hypothetical protein
LIFASAFSSFLISTRLAYISPSRFAIQYVARQTTYVE